MNRGRGLNGMLPLPTSPAPCNPCPGHPLHSFPCPGHARHNFRWPARSRRTMWRMTWPLSDWTTLNLCISESINLGHFWTMNDYISASACTAPLPGPRLADVCGAPTFVLFLSFIEKLIRTNDKISGRCDRITPIETPEDKYDFIVIGGGGAGAVAAARLSENPHWNVLLLEAGPDEPAFGAIPLFDGGLLGGVVDWEYTTTNESYACLASNGSCPFITGKMLGGSTSHNGMLYNRGIPKDYADWAASGNDGWTWDDVLPYYLLGEDNGEIKRVGEHYHATGGQLSVERFLYMPPLANSILAASVEKGYNVSEDLNGEQYSGFSILQTTTKNGVRRSSAAAYLRPAKDRKNLHISLDSRATKLIIENERAVGVEFYKGGELKTVHMSKEVIVSAGTIESPKLLLLSGIGPKEHLEEVGIDVVKNLPGTGENFHDHVNFVLTFTINEADKYDNDWAIATEYFHNQTGPLSGLGLASVMGRLASKAASLGSTDFVLNFFGYTESCAPGDIGGLHSTGQRTVGIRVANINPKSRGKISLASKDPLVNPVVWGNFLSEKSDVDVLVYAIETGLSLADTKALRAHNYTLSLVPMEACSKYTFPSADYWACAVRRNSGISFSHPAGTCKMGPSSDSMAVVNPRLLVHGFKNIRVADNSIMPKVTSGNTGAPAMMIGERVADFIKKDWGHSD